MARPNGKVVIATGMPSSIGNAAEALAKTAVNISSGGKTKDPWVLER